MNWPACGRSGRKNARTATLDSVAIGRHSQRGLTMTNLESDITANASEIAGAIFDEAAGATLAEKLDMICLTKLTAFAVSTPLLPL
mgnify:CR=1 FL=1